MIQNGSKQMQQKVYTTISEELLADTGQWACQFIDISEERETILMESKNH